MFRGFVVIIILGFQSYSLFAQAEIKAVFTDSIPVLDGWVNEAFWNRGSMVNELYQREPNTGEPATET